MFSANTYLYILPDIITILIVNCKRIHYVQEHIGCRIWTRSYFAQKNIINAGHAFLLYWDGCFQLLPIDRTVRQLDFYMFDINSFRVICWRLMVTDML